MFGAGVGCGVTAALLWVCRERSSRMVQAFPKLSVHPVSLADSRAPHKLESHFPCVLHDFPSKAGALLRIYFYAPEKKKKELTKHLFSGLDQLRKQV